MHPEEDISNNVDEDFNGFLKFPIVTALVQPMDQGVIAKLERMYKKQSCAVYYWLMTMEKVLWSLTS